MVGEATLYQVSCRLGISWMPAKSGGSSPLDGEVEWLLWGQCSVRSTEMNDNKLIADLLAGVPEAVEQIRSWIRLSLLSYRARLGNLDEDLEQEILIGLLSTLREGGFRGSSQLRTYVRSWVHHKCIDRLRLQERRIWISIEDLELASRQPSSFDQASSKQTVAIALEVVERLSDSCRELFRLILKGASYREMSDQLGVGEGALRARVLRCRRRALELREEINSNRQRNKH